MSASDPIELQALDVLADAFGAIDLSKYELPPPQVFQRQLVATDEAPSIGVFLSSWIPVEPPAIGLPEPTTTRYRFGVQTYIKSIERAPGQRMSIEFTKLVRSVLYRDEQLQGDLGRLRQGEFSPIERALRWGVDTTAYDDGAISGGFAFLSQTDIYFETEVA